MDRTTPRTGIAGPVALIVAGGALIAISGAMKAGLLGAVLMLALYGALMAFFGRQPRRRAR